MKKLLNSIDLFDVLVFIGFVSLAFGLGLISIRLMLVACGILLMVFGLFGAGIFSVKEK